MARSKLDCADAAAVDCSGQTRTRFCVSTVSQNLDNGGRDTYVDQRVRFLEGGQTGCHVGGEKSGGDDSQLFGGGGEGGEHLCNSVLASELS